MIKRIESDRYGLRLSNTETIFPITSGKVFKLSLDEKGEPITVKLEIPEEFKSYFSDEKSIYHLVIEMLHKNYYYFTCDVDSRDRNFSLYTKEEKSSILKNKLASDDVKIFTIDKLIEIINFYKGD